MITLGPHLSLQTRTLRNPLSSPNPQSLPPDQHGDRQQPKHTHQHTEDAKRLSSTLMRNPLANKERPRETDNSSHTRNSNEAVSSKHAIGLNQVVETNGWRLHEPESNKSEAELETDPACRRGVLRYEAEDQSADCGQRERRECGDETGFRFREAVEIFLCEALGCEVGDEVGVDLEVMC